MKRLLALLVAVCLCSCAEAAPPVVPAVLPAPAPPVVPAVAPAVKPAKLLMFPNLRKKCRLERKEARIKATLAAKGVAAK